MKEYKEFPFDINLLEYPLYFVDEKQGKNVFSYKNNNGYTITSIKKPTKIDILILYYLLLKSKNNKWEKKIYVSSYELIKNCNLSKSKNTYDRIKQSLKVWISTYIQFDKCFYTHNDNKISLDLNILQHFEHTKNKKLEIVFTDKFLEMIKESNFFQKMDFDKIKQIKNPTSMRLYDILIKSFHNRTKWMIGIHKLAEKIPIQDIYMSHIIKKIETSVKIINDKTSLNIKMSVKKTERNQGIFTFEKVSKSLLDIMKEEQQMEAKKQEKVFNKEDILKNFDDKEIEAYKKEYIEKELPKNKYLTKIYNSKGFNDVIEMSFLSYLKTKIPSKNE